MRTALQVGTTVPRRKEGLRKLPRLSFVGSARPAGPESLVSHSGLFLQQRADNVGLPLSPRQHFPAGEVESWVLGVVTIQLQQTALRQGIDDPSDARPVGGSGAHHARLSAADKRVLAVNADLAHRRLRGTHCTRSVKPRMGDPASPARSSGDRFRRARRNSPRCLSIHRLVGFGRSHLAPGAVSRLGRDLVARSIPTAPCARGCRRRTGYDQDALTFRRRLVESCRLRSPSPI